jgi:glycosyltransferase involved in cell wall biosynthesis
MILSVALCTYNGEQYIREQLESILNQTMPVDEIVVCDDGSTDKTLQIIEEYRDKTAADIRIYCNENNLGVVANFQKAINLCCGDIIFLSDQDDIWRPDKVETIVQYFDNHPPINTLFTNASLIDSNSAPIQGTLWDFCFGKDVRMLFDAGLKFECFAYGNHATGATMALRKTKLPTIHYTPDFLHDHALALLAADTDSLGYIDQCLISYRLHTSQVCGIKKAAKLSWFDLVYVMQETTALPLSKETRERLDFNTTRIATRKKILAPLIILSMQDQYRKLYKKASRTMMRLDIQESFNHKFRYIASKLHL